MRTSRDEYDLRIGFSFIDSPALLLLPERAFSVYLKLRRYVWRSKEGDLGREFQAGFLVSPISQGKIATELGVSREHVNKTISKLEEIGWIRKRRIKRDANFSRGGLDLVYVLGERIRIQGSGVTEVFYADALQERFEELLSDTPGANAAELLGEVWKAGRQPDPDGGGEEIENSPDPDGFGDPHVNQDHNPSGSRSQGEWATITTPVTEAHTEVEKEEGREGKKAEKGRNNGAASPRADRVSPSGGEEGNEETVGSGVHSSDSETRSSSGSPRVDTMRQLTEAAAHSIARTSEIARQERLKRTERLKRMQEKGFEPPQQPKKMKRIDREAAGRLEVIFEEVVKEAFPEMVPPRWVERDQAMATSLVRRYPIAVVERTVRYMVENWELLARELKLGGFPSIGLLAGAYGDSIFGMAQTGKKFGQASADREQKLRGEYDSESAKRSPKFGWGK